MSDCNCNQTVPSPLPPWRRNSTACAAPQTLVEDGQIDLSTDVTILDSVVGGPYAITLPNGDASHFASAAGNQKQIYIPKANENTTAVFVVTGTFVGFSTLKFNNLGFSAILKWINGGWNLVGGNALAE